MLAEARKGKVGGSCTALLVRFRACYGVAWVQVMRGRAVGCVMRLAICSPAGIVHAL